jgi:predicted phosphohydrolase
MIMGNHEYYRGVLNAEIPKLRAFFVTQGISNIHILENQTYEFDDALVFGTSLWTSCRNNNPVIKHAVQNGLVDYKRISVMNASGEKSLITPEDTISLHYLAMQALHNFLQVPTQKRRIVLTHFAPHILSIEPCYKKYLTTDGYYEELYELIANSDVNTWVHGHTHFPVDYTIENTRVISNPRGYYGSEPTAMRFKVKSF